MAKHDGTVLLNPDKALVCDFIAEWVERNRPSIQSTTYCGYKHVLDSHISPYFKNLGVTIYQIAPIHIDRYIQTKLAEGLNPNTVLKHCYIIRSALEVAKKQRFIRENVVDAVDKPSERKYTPAFYNKDEINELLTAARGTALETPVFLAAFFGLRRSEIVGLRWESIDFSE